MGLRVQKNLLLVCLSVDILCWHFEIDSFVLILCEERVETFNFQFIITPRCLLLLNDFKIPFHLFALFSFQILFILTYAAIYLHHMHIEFLSLFYSICKDMLDVWKDYKARQANDKEVDKTGLSTVLIEVIFL